MNVFYKKHCNAASMMLMDQSMIYHVTMHANICFHSILCFHKTEDEMRAHLRNCQKNFQAMQQSVPNEKILNKVNSKYIYLYITGQCIWFFNCLFFNVFTNNYNSHLGYRMIIFLDYFMMNYILTLSRKSFHFICMFTRLFFHRLFFCCLHI